MAPLPTGLIFVSGQRFRLHRVVQPPHVPIGDRSHDDANMFPAGLQLLGQLHPPLIAMDNSMHGFDDHGSELRIAGLDHARVRLLVAAGAVPRRQAAEPSQLLAGLEAVESPNLRSHRRCRHQADPFLLAELFHHGVVCHPLL